MTTGASVGSLGPTRKDDAMYMNVFEYRLRDDADRGAYQAHGERMYALVTSDPCFEFIDMKVYPVSENEGVVLERFGSLDGARRWAANPEHQVTMQYGREHVYAWYRGTACVVDHEYGTPR